VISITIHIITLIWEPKLCKLKCDKYSSLTWNQKLINQMCINQEMALCYTVNETASIKGGILLWDERERSQETRRLGEIN
jgi:hypothetical protein